MSGAGELRIDYSTITLIATDHTVGEGDVIEIKEKSREIGMVLDALDSPERDIPEYMEVDLGKRRGTFARTPNFSEVPYPVSMEPNLVIEYYSR